MSFVNLASMPSESLSTQLLLVGAWVVAYERKHTKIDVASSVGIPKDTSWTTVPNPNMQRDEHHRGRVW